jgi:predicted DNA-binding transcriptional regulator AlpA
MDEQQPGTLLTPKEVARRLGVQVKTLANWRTQGIGPRPFVMVSAKAVRYPEDAVARFLADRTVGDDDDAPFPSPGAGGAND